MNIDFSIDKRPLEVVGPLVVRESVRLGTHADLCISEGPDRLPENAGTGSAALSVCLPDGGEIAWELAVTGIERPLAAGAGHLWVSLQDPASLLDRFAGSRFHPAGTTFCELLKNLSGSGGQCPQRPPEKELKLPGFAFQAHEGHWSFFRRQAGRIGHGGFWNRAGVAVPKLGGERTAVNISTENLQGLRARWGMRRPGQTMTTIDLETRKLIEQHWDSDAGESCAPIAWGSERSRGIELATPAKGPTIRGCLERPAPRLGTALNLTGLDNAEEERFLEKLSGGSAFVLTEVRHEIHSCNGSYEAACLWEPPSEFDRAAGWHRPASHTLVQAVVEAIDSDCRHRIKVRLEGDSSEVTSDWIPVLKWGGQGDVGIYWLPELGERVQVLVDRWFPESAICLGSIRPDGCGASESMAPKSGKKRWLVSPGGLAIEFDDVRGVLVLRAGDAFLEISSSGATLDVPRVVINGKQGVSLGSKGTVKIDGMKVELG